MKIYKFIAIIALAAFFIFGCSSNAPDAPAMVSPTETLKTFIEASKTKDIETVKRTLSKASLELAEKTAAQQQTTVDELLKRGNSDMLDEAPEISNERIENDTATVDVKVKTIGVDTIPFVKEDGAWKIAFDKYQQALMEKMRQQMSQPAANLSSAPTNQPTNAPGNAPKNAPANKPATNK